MDLGTSFHSPTISRRRLRNIPRMFLYKFPNFLVRAICNSRNIIKGYEAIAMKSS